MVPLIAQAPLNSLIITEGALLCKGFIRIALTVAISVFSVFAILSLTGPISVVYKASLLSATLLLTFLDGMAHGKENPTGYRSALLDLYFGPNPSWVIVAVKVIVLVSLTGLSFWTLQSHISIETRLVSSFMAWLASHMVGLSWGRDYRFSL